MMGTWGGGVFGYPFFGLGMMLFWFLIFLIIGYIVFLDANARGMHGLLWWILIIIPMIGIIALFLYVILRESRGEKITQKELKPLDILKERYAKGEITSEDYHKMKGDLEK